MMSFVLIHQFNKERKVVEAEHITPTYVSIRWGQSGIYDLLLESNTLRARSQKAQRRGKALWGAEDIHAVRKMVADVLQHGLKDEQDKEKQKAEFRRHSETMPNEKTPCVCGWANCKGQCAGRVRAR